MNCLAGLCSQIRRLKDERAAASLGQLRVPAFGEPAVERPVDLYFEVDAPESSQLANKGAAHQRNLPGLTRVLEQSSSTASTFREALKTGFQVSGAALGIPGLTTLQVVAGPEGHQFFAVESGNQLRELPGRQKSGDLSCSYDGNRSLTFSESLIFEPAQRDRWGNCTNLGAFGLLPVRSRGLKVESCFEDLTLTTEFDHSGQAVKAAYKANLSEGRHLKVDLKKDETYGEICLSQAGTRGGTKPEQVVTVNHTGCKTEAFYHSPFDPYPF
ncbi:MAG: hypothetical protein U0931_24370 [Vulcanimicrobiota bacterium]